MLFWWVITAISICVAGFLAAALRVSATTIDDEEQEITFYKSQLDEIKQDLKRGLVSDEDAQSLHTEIARRILAVDKSVSRVEPKLQGWWFYFLSAVTAIVLIFGSLSLYNIIGIPGYADLPQAKRIELSEDYRLSRLSLQDWLKENPRIENLPTNKKDQQLLNDLRMTVAARPDDIQGQILLARVEAGLLNFFEASEAQKNVVRLKGDNASVDDHFNQVEMLILAAKGYVSPEAETGLRRILAKHPTHKPSLYYIGLMFLQIDRPDRAFILWKQLLEKSSVDSPWIEPIRMQIEEVAAAAGITDYKLPPLDELENFGPSQADIEAAQEMTAYERTEMIDAMVEGLAERLATKGGQLEDWVRLIKALTVLGKNDEAKAILHEAQSVFEQYPDAINQINKVATIIELIK